VAAGPRSSRKSFAASAAWVPNSVCDMIVETDNYLTFEVTFSVGNREAGFNDDIRFAMRESGPTARILRTDECSLLLTPNQAERLAEALLQTADESRAAGNRERRTSRPRQPRGGALAPNPTRRV
jgi:hypothetical protein